MTHLIPSSAPKPHHGYFTSIIRTGTTQGLAFIVRYCGDGAHDGYEMEQVEGARFGQDKGCNENKAHHFHKARPVSMERGL